MHHGVDRVGQPPEVGRHEIVLDEGEAARIAQTGDVSLLDGACVVVEEAIDPHDLVAARDQRLRDLRADEAGRTCDQYPHVLE
jgi:hypothetical protein